MEVEGGRLGQDNLGAILEEGGFQAGLSRFRLSKLWGWKDVSILLGTRTRLSTSV